MPQDSIIHTDATSLALVRLYSRTGDLLTLAALADRLEECGVQTWRDLETFAAAVQTWLDGKSKTGWRVHIDAQALVIALPGRKNPTWPRMEELNGLMPLMADIRQTCWTRIDTPVLMFRLWNRVTRT